MELEDPVPPYSIEFHLNSRFKSIKPTWRDRVSRARPLEQSVSIEPPRPGVHPDPHPHLLRRSVIESGQSPPLVQSAPVHQRCRPSLENLLFDGYLPIVLVPSIPRSCAVPLPMCPCTSRHHQRPTTHLCRAGLLHHRHIDLRQRKRNDDPRFETSLQGCQWQKTWLHVHPESRLFAASRLNTLHMSLPIVRSAQGIDPASSLCQVCLCSTSSPPHRKTARTNSQELDLVALCDRWRSWPRVLS